MHTDCIKRTCTHTHTHTPRQTDRRIRNTQSSQYKRRSTRKTPHLKSGWPKMTDTKMTNRPELQNTK